MHPCRKLTNERRDSGNPKPGRYDWFDGPKPDEPRDPGLKALPQTFASYVPRNADSHIASSCLGKYLRAEPGLPHVANSEADHCRSRMTKIL